MEYQKQALILGGGRHEGNTLPDDPESLDLLQRLRAVFTRGYLAYRSRNLDEAFDDTTLNGLVTYNTMMDVLREL
jgi:hypothetical protein